MPEEEPALPPDPALLNRQPKWFKKVFYGVIVGSNLFLLVLLSLPFFVRTNFRRADQVEAISNAHEIGAVLFEFEKRYGSFPDEKTAKTVTENFPDHGLNLSGKSSNALFRQLFAANLTQKEGMFYAKVKDSRRPDGVIDPGEALKKSEVGFAYIAGLSSTVDPNTPVLLSPMITGTIMFDPKPFYDRAVVLRIDGSATSYTIHKDGHIYDKGIDLLSPKHPIWKGKKPDIRYPE